MKIKYIITITMDVNQHHYEPPVATAQEAAVAELALWEQGYIDLHDLVEVSDISQIGVKVEAAE